MAKTIEQILMTGAKQVMRQVLKPKLTQSLKRAKEYAEIVSPVDTGDYISSFGTDVRETEQSIIGELRNTDEKATGVERGRRKTDSRRSKEGGSPIVEYGVGARVFQKTGVFLQDDFINSVGRG